MAVLWSISGAWLKRLTVNAVHGRDGMAREDDEPLMKRRRLEPLLLDSLGIEELRDYIDELKTEIVRVEADIERKHGHRSAADAFFRRP